MYSIKQKQRKTSPAQVAILEAAEVMNSMPSIEEESSFDNQQANNFSAAEKKQTYTNINTAIKTDDEKGFQNLATGLNVVDLKTPLKEDARLFVSDDEDLHYESYPDSSMLSDEDLTRLGISLGLCIRAYDTTSGEAKTFVCASKEAVRKIRRELNDKNALFYSSVAGLIENGFEPVENQDVLLKIKSKNYKELREIEETLYSSEIPGNLTVFIDLYSIYKEDWVENRRIPHWLLNTLAVNYEEIATWPSKTNICVVCKTPKIAADLTEKIKQDKQSIIDKKPEVIEAKLNQTIVRMIDEGDLEGLKELHAKENLDLSKPRSFTITLPERDLAEGMENRRRYGYRRGRASEDEKENDEYMRAKTKTLKTTIPCQAAAEGQLEIIRWLIEEQKVDIDASNPEGYTMLFLALKKQHVTLANYLLEKNANVNIMDHRRRTPLHVVIAGARKGFERLLMPVLEKTQDVNIVNKDGITPLEWALRIGRLDIIAMLKEKGAILFPEGVDAYWVKENIKKILFSAVAKEDYQVMEQFVPLLLKFKDEAGDLISSELNKGLYKSIMENYYTKVHEEKIKVIKVLLVNGAKFVDRERIDWDTCEPRKITAEELKNRMIQLIKSSSVREKNPSLYHEIEPYITGITNPSTVSAAFYANSSQQELHTASCSGHVSVIPKI